MLKIKFSSSIVILLSVQSKAYTHTHRPPTLNPILRRSKSSVFDYRLDLFVLADRMVFLDRVVQERFCKYVYSIFLLSGFWLLQGQQDIILQLHHNNTQNLI